FNALIGLEVELHPKHLPLRIHPLKSVGAETIHLAQARRDTTITKQPGELVCCLRRVGEKVEHILRLLAVRIRVRLLTMNEVRKLDAIPDKERWRVVADQVPVPVFGIKLHRKASWVPLGIRRSPGAGDRRETGKHLGTLTHLR